MKLNEFWRWRPQPTYTKIHLEISSIYFEVKEQYGKERISNLIQIPAPPNPRLIEEHLEKQIYDN